MIRRFLYLLVLGFVSACAPAQNVSAESSPELTVYNDNLALVKDVFQAEVGSGISTLEMEGIAAQIDPTSVHIKSLTAPEKFQVLEQNYEFDLINYGRLLEKYIGKEVEVYQYSENGSGDKFVQKGRLLSSGYALQPYHSGGSFYQYGQSGSPMIEIDGKIHTGIMGHLVLPELPEGLILKPTLTWQVLNQGPESHDMQLSYLTSGIKWNADYVAVIDEKTSTLDFTGWVTLDNRSGASYENAKLKLVAGDVNRVQDQPVHRKHMRMEFAMMADAGGAQFNEQSFFEYHLYTLQRPTTVKDQEMKQVELMNAAFVPFKKEYITENGGKVNVIVEIENEAQYQLGMPLPKGKVRLYQEDAEGSQQFIGEDRIDHTPKDETVRLKVGSAFDIKVERRQTNYNVVKQNKRAEESYEIKIRNHKEEDVVVKVVEHVHRSHEWKILESSHDFKKESSSKIEAFVNVPKDGEAKVTYTIRYDW